MPDSPYFSQVEAELAHLGLVQFAPHAALRPWVQRYFWVKTANCPEAMHLDLSHEKLSSNPSSSSIPPETALTSGFTQRLYPDGGSTLTCHFSKGHLPDIRFYASQVVCEQLYPQGVEQLSVRFYPGGAFHLLGLELQSLMSAGAWVDIDASLCQLPGLERFRQQLAEATSRAACIQLLDGWLMSLVSILFSQKAAGQSLVQATLPLLLQTHSSLEHFYEQVPLSRRQFERKFKAETGLSPLQIQQFSKIKLARNLLSYVPHMSLAEVALASGFYDQAHLNQQFVRFTEQTPGQYKKRKMSQISKAPKD